MKYKNFINVGLLSVVLYLSSNIIYAQENDSLKSSTHVTANQHNLAPNSIMETLKTIGFVSIGTIGLAGIGLTYFLLRLANSGKIKVKSPKQQNESDFLDCCRKGDLEKLKYLIKEKNINICCQNDLAIQCASTFKHLNIVKYLLTSPDLKKHSNIHVNDDDIFKSAYQDKYMDLIQYLVFELKIKKTKTIQEYIKGNLELTQMFNNRDLNEKLNSNLLEEKQKQKIHHKL